MFIITCDTCIMTHQVKNVVNTERMLYQNIGLLYLLYKKGPTSFLVLDIILMNIYVYIHLLLSTNRFEFQNDTL